MAGGARCRVRSGGGLRSSGRKSTGSVSISEHQESLVRRYPGATYIVLRPRSGSAVSASLPDDYQFDMCQNILDQYYDMSRLCGSDFPMCVTRRSTILKLCGIEVPADDLDKKASTSTNAAAQL
ncbi:PREDICTED: uncharacterized protein LOC101310185 [Fragaria vesca subsp. vesca]|uniref:uncharacterized protein LOC101310185 n=1 Tax=Fragaria vesca subsp. vesca TaxID=101020 RepID=UPI0002C33B05|nr:PREDICTED: uncharacterized protein LOC101310185 [Fragaria vesca subsp. vesca]